MTHFPEVVLQVEGEKENVAEENAGKLVKKPATEENVGKQEEESERVADADNRFIYIIYI